MKKRHLISILIFVLIILTLVFIGQTSNSEEICIENKKCFSVILAQTGEEKRIGLSETESLAENEGMLFIFSQETRPGFWMKDMNFPIDIIWIDENLEIEGFEKNIQPCTENCRVYYSPNDILYVLEINANLSDEYGFEIGDKISL